ncbi:flagella synthesis protein FlgN [Herminiimonas fonticola]|uniref:Flagella synthesis protein FlgN n=1 Tax=Herminiimonas fonticola TaxID=303380 RepID=A0A4R6GKL3_9BURK|nr:flagellar protein FlgN [Herminiimonas fonticola]RBA25776.1 Flagellar biosynthesis/type III secretory pathway chaperone [Herminiimonas fonticola]TDN94884.1 flagella synthesis protein FlgN [Herminiimonas fonticola]
MSSSDINPADSLIKEHQAVRALTELLQQEQEQLVAGNIEAIAALTEPKAKAAVRMAELAAGRHQALAKAGFEADESGMKVWLATPAASETAQQSWRELIALAEVGKELNRVNGTLINKQMVRNQNVLNILQHGSVQGNAVYGPDGQTANKSVKRHIVAG